MYGSAVGVRLFFCVLSVRLRVVNNVLHTLIIKLNIFYMHRYCKREGIGNHSIKAHSNYKIPNLFFLIC